MSLHLNTVSDLLWSSLQKLMEQEEFKPFRLVGGTSLSLQLGHRESVDIDLFTDADYGSIDFKELENCLEKTFSFVDKSSVEMVGMGKSYFVGNNENELVKLDIFYTDPFVFPIILEQNIRMASKEEIVAMKFEVIAQGGRKKDFWDVHELMDSFSIEQMVDFYLKRNPYGFSKKEITKQITNFSIADDDFTPNCYRGKIWELIKLDFEEYFEKLKS